MSRPASHRWPFTDLDHALRTHGYTTRPDQAQALHIPERTLWRWKRHGVPDHAADQAAIHLDSHPSLIWTNWNHHPTDDPDDEFAPAPIGDTEVA